jgi:uncharacterized protein (TIGR03067 family)
MVKKNPCLGFVALLALFFDTGISVFVGDEIAGAWRVVSVEFAGERVPGLEGARLEFAQGKKTFTLPSGAVEEGTYTLDPAREPKWIDSTTTGRGSREKGIYSIEGDILRLCLSQGGKERPEGFATRRNSDLILIVLRRAGAPLPAPPPEPAPAVTPGSIKKPEGRRSFRMGFTGFVPDLTPEAVAGARAFVRENGDILAHHIEGVPWAESLAGLPFPAKLLEEWTGKKSAVPPRGKVYLAISPGRGDLKPADHAAPIPAEIAGKPYDHPRVMEAYLNYVRRMIEFFAPDYLAIGIEVNEIHDAGAEKWKAYAALHRHVYQGIKKMRPDLPVFASFTIHNIFKKRGAMLAAFEELMPFNDLVAASYYPFFVPDEDRLSALDWTVEEFGRFGKPFAVVETNDEAERLPLPSLGVTIEGTPERQLAYYEKLLALARDRKFRFVISFIHQDYDALWEKIKGSSPELFMAWRDCGLLDERGRPRPALEVWRSYLALPLEE